MKTYRTRSVFRIGATALAWFVFCSGIAAFAADEPEDYAALVKELVAKEGNCNVANRIDYLDSPENPLPVAPLLPLLDHHSPQVRQGAAYTLRLMQNRKQCSAQLLAAAQKEQNVYALTEMVQGLGAIGNAAATPLLSDMMVKHASADVRYAAVEAEYWIRDTNAVPALLRATLDTSPKVAVRALYVLGNIGDTRAVTRFVRVASEGDRDARVSAVQALGMLGAADAAPFLRSLLISEDIPLLQQAVWALGRAHDAKTVASLLPLLQYSDQPIAKEARLSLLQIGDDEVLLHFIGRYRADPNDSLALDIIRSIYGQRHRIGEPLKGLSADQTAALAEHLSTVSKKLVEPAHIRLIRHFHGTLFVQVALDGSGSDFIVIRADDGTFEGAKAIQSWIE